MLNILILNIFFLILPFTLGAPVLDYYKFGQVLEISNFLTVLLFLGWFGKVSIFGQYIFNKSPLYAPVLFFLSLVILSYFRNPKPIMDQMNLFYGQAAISLMLYLIVSNIIVRKEQIDKIRRALFVFYNIAFFITLVICFTGKQLPFMASTSFADRTGGTFISGGGVHGIGVYGTVCILFLLAQPSYIRTRWIRILLLVMYFSALPLSGSRSIFLTISGTLILMFLIQRNFKYVIFLSVSVVILLSFPRGDYHSLPPVVQRMIDFSPETRDASLRTIMWKGAWELIKENPIWGIGYNIVPDSKVPFEMFKAGPGAALMFSRGLHNAYISVLRSLGLVGIAIFGWIILAFFRQIAYLQKTVQDTHLREFVFFITMYVVTNLVKFVIAGGETSPMLYLFLGLASAIYTMSKKKVNVMETLPKGSYIRSPI